MINLVVGMGNAGNLAGRLCISKRLGVQGLSHEKGTRLRNVLTDMYDVECGINPIGISELSF